MFKDETGGELVVEFIGLRAKMYSILRDDGEVKDAAKGVDTYVKKHILKHSDFRDALFKDKVISKDISRIVQESHELYKQVNHKVCLRSFNDKKFIVREGDTFTCYSFGHRKIGDIQVEEALTDFEMNVNIDDMTTDFLM